MTDPFKNFSLNDWLSYILIRHQQCDDRDIDRLRPIAKYYDLLNFDCPVISVTGTNGKGSCVKSLENIYRAQGYRVATYTSPHCLEFNERIAINGHPVSDREIVNAFEHIEAVRSDVNLRFFEFITLAALYVFKQKPLDVILLEVGVGGKRDPVNLIDASLSILTTIGMDHADLLGQSRDDIAKAKIALFRSNRPAICGELASPQIVFDYAKQLHTKLYWIHREFEYAYNLAEHTWHWQMDNIEYHQLQVPQIKLQNAATALAAITVLQRQLPVKNTSIVKGLKNTRLPGRFEIIKPPYRCILDVAHNVQSVKWLVEQLQKLNIKGKIHAVFSMLQGKDISTIINCIKPLIAAWYIAPLNGFTRASAHEQIITTLNNKQTKENYFFESVPDAFSAAETNATTDDCVLVFGSFHTVAAVKTHETNK